MIQNVIPIHRETASYADEHMASLNCRAICAEASLTCLRSELLVVLAQLECSAAVAARHNDHATASAWGDSARLIRDAIGRAGE